MEVYILGQTYEVPEGLTILRAFEWAGFHLVRGVGCREGFCGACATVYRIQGDYRLHYALACQTVVQAGMILAPLPFFPAPRPAYHLEDLPATGQTLVQLYPEILRCFGCNTCTKACPQELDVLGYMASAVRGEVAAVADASFDCILCGLCTARCPAELVPGNVALLARRLYGKSLAPKATHLRLRLGELAQGRYQAQVEELKSLSHEDLKARYEARDIEP